MMTGTTKQRNDWTPDEDRLARETAELLRFGTRLLITVSAVAAMGIVGALVLGAG